MHIPQLATSTLQCSAAQLLGGKPGQCTRMHSMNAAKCTAPEAPCISCRTSRHRGSRKETLGQASAISHAEWAGLQGRVIQRTVWRRAIPPALGEPHFMAPEVITKANQANRGAMAMVQNWCRFLQPLRTQLNSQAYRPKDTWKRNRTPLFSNAAMEDNASTSFEMMKII